MTHLDLNRDDNPDPHRRESDQPQVMKVLQVALGVITIIGLIFTVGYNWRGVDTLEKNQDQFVRKDVLDQQMRRMDDKMTEMLRQMEEMRLEQRDARRKP